MEDSLTGDTTTLNIIAPAEINTSETTSGLSKATHGGKAIVNILGGTLEKSVESLDASCTNISLVTIGTIGMDIGIDDSLLSVHVDSQSEPAFVEINDSYLYGYLSAGSNSKVDISGGSFGQDSTGISEIADAASGTARVNTSGGTFSGLNSLLQIFSLIT